MSEQPRRRPSFIFPLLLVGLGFFLLFWNLDLLPEGAWENLAALWPVFLVLLGIDLVIRSVSRGWPAQILRFLIALTLLGGAFVLAASPGWAPGGGFDVHAPWKHRHRTVHERVGAAESAHVRIDWNRHPGTIGPAASEGDLLRAELGYRDRLVYEVDRGRDRTEIRLDTREQHMVLPLIWIERHGRRSEMRWDVELGTAIPLSLDLETGSRGVRLNLTEHEVEELRLDMSSGSVDLVLPRRGGWEAVLDGASGRATVEVPEELELRIEVDRGSGTFSVSDRFERVEGEGGVWQTSGYEDGDNRATLSIDQGSGSIRLR